MSGVVRALDQYHSGWWSGECIRSVK